MKRTVRAALAASLASGMVFAGVPASATDSDSDDPAVQETNDPKVQVDPGSDPVGDAGEPGDEPAPEPPSKDATLPSTPTDGLEQLPDPQPATPTSPRPSSRPAVESPGGQEAPPRNHDSVPSYPSTQSASDDSLGFPASNGDTAPDQSDNSDVPSTNGDPQASDDEDFQSISSRAKAAGTRASRFVRSLQNLPPDTDQGGHIGSQLSNIGQQAVAGQNAQTNASDGAANPSGQDGTADAEPSQSPALGPEAKTHEPAMRQSLQYGQNLYHGGHRTEQVSAVDERLSDTGAQAQTMTIASLSLLVAGGGILVARRRGAHRA